MSNSALFALIAPTLLSCAAANTLSGHQHASQENRQPMAAIALLLAEVRAGNVAGVVEHFAPDGISCGSDVSTGPGEIQAALLDVRTCAHRSMFDADGYASGCPGGKFLLSLSEVAGGKDIGPVLLSESAGSDGRVMLAEWHHRRDARAFYLSLRRVQGRWMIDDDLFCYDAMEGK